MVMNPDDQEAVGSNIEIFVFEKVYFSLISVMLIQNSKNSTVW